MKRTLSVVIFFSLLLLLGCNSKAIVGNNKQPVAIRESTTDAEQSNSGWIEMPSYFSFEDYEKNLFVFMEIPGFVTYDSIKEYGEFVSLVFLDLFMTEDVGYVYDLLGPDGFQFSLYIFPADRQFERSPDTSVLMEVESQSNLGSNKNENGVYYANDVEYLYWNGKVTRISWSTPSRFISIIASTETYFPNFNQRNTSLINSLLNAETAPAAIAEFSRKVSQ